MVRAGDGQDVDKAVQAAAKRLGVHLKDRMITMGSRGKGGDDGGEVIEFTVVGTAVRAPWITHPPGQPARGSSPESAPTW